jgi:hypothetical protein
MQDQVDSGKETRRFWPQLVKVPDKAWEMRVRENANAHGGDYTLLAGASQYHLALQHLAARRRALPVGDTLPLTPPAQCAK